MAYDPENSSLICNFPSFLTDASKTITSHCIGLHKKHIYASQLDNFNMVEKVS